MDPYLLSTIILSAFGAIVVFVYHLWYRVKHKAKRILEEVGKKEDAQDYKIIEK